MVKRKFERVDRQLLVNYDHFNFDNIKDDQGMARTLDMSVRGLHLQLPRAVTPGSSLRLALDLKGEVIEVFGEVRWCEADQQGMFEAGVELKYVPEKFIAAIEAHFRDK